MKLTSVLIAEDSAELRRTMKLCLEAEGYEVRVASNGAEALVLQNRAPADVLITDLFMPESDGFEAIDSFRKRYPRTRIIAMSGNGKQVRREFLSVARLLGVDATLKKPFGMDALLQALRDL
jgi:CheY-like chemotaxis protein